MCLCIVRVRLLNYVTLLFASEDKKPRTQMENLFSISIFFNFEYEIIKVNYYCLFYLQQQNLMNLFPENKSASNLLKTCIKID